jgi:quinol monooxygenase YgiN
MWKRDLMIVNTMRITLRPRKQKEFFQAIGRLLEPIKETKGCLTFRCYVDSSDENSSLLIGEWETESDLESYLRSNDFAILHGAITVLSLQSTDCRALITQVISRHTAPGNFSSKMGNGWP